MWRFLKLQENVGDSRFLLNTGKNLTQYKYIYYTGTRKVKMKSVDKFNTNKTVFRYVSHVMGSSKYR